MRARASLLIQTVKTLPAIQETWVRSLVLEDSLEKGMATYSSILAWRMPWTEDPGRLQSTGSQRIRHDWATNTHTHIHTMWGPIPDFLNHKDVRQAELRTTVTTIKFFCLYVPCIWSAYYKENILLCMTRDYLNHLSWSYFHPSNSAHSILELPWGMGSPLERPWWKTLTRYRCPWMFVLLTNGWV